MSLRHLISNAIDLTGSSRPEKSTLVEIPPITMKFDEEYVSFPPALRTNSECLFDW